jgi:hypothetical protein
MLLPRKIVSLRKVLNQALLVGIFQTLRRYLVYGMESIFLLTMKYTNRFVFFCDLIQCSVNYGS